MGVVRARDGRGNYVKLNTTAPSDEWTPGQFVKPKKKVPYKAIGLAVGLFVLGSLFLSLGAGLQTGYIETQYHDRGIPLLVLGSLMFIPGAYHVAIAYYTYMGYRGYSYNDIPSFDD
eukprot:comp20508_c0_seq1/m.26232 comp20508_c0_seq1/g.26232  ORF comp20508_c0_seq1/g.26232 comp20508_c0_seq1/m.26232 type:complete len:117 (-) comp20508_c0_seq1:565-915(-)